MTEEGTSDSDQESIRNSFQNVKTKYKSLNQLRIRLSQEEKECSRSVHQLKEKFKDGKDVFRNKQEKLEYKAMLETLQDMTSTFRHPPTFILRMIIGDISVSLSNNEDKLTYKQEYEKFKLINTTLMMILTVISLIFHQYNLPSALVHCVSVWYYFAITLRELILMTNGSKINWWWLLHHYCSIIIALLFLIWPPGECYKSFKAQIMLFSFCLSCVMTLQFRYQRAKLYRQVAMGKTHHMSVSQESSISMVFDFSFLVVCLSGIYLFQFYNAYSLFKLYMYEADCDYYQVLCLSGMFVLVALLNSLTLMLVLYFKLKKFLSTNQLKQE